MVYLSGQEQKAEPTSHGGLGSGQPALAAETFLYSHVHGQHTLRGRIRQGWREGQTHAPGESPEVAFEKQI